jgi:hypothetical protein
MAQEARRDGAGFMVIGRTKQLEDLGSRQLEAQGIDVVSVESIEGASREETQFHHDSHYNEVGHERLARFLAPLVESRLDARTQAGGSAG